MIFKEKYNKFKATLEANKLYRLSFISLMMQLLSGISVFIFILLSLILFQLSNKLVIDVLQVNRATNSDKIVMIDTFNKDMADINNKVTKVMIQYFIETTFSMHFGREDIDRKFGPRAEVYFLTTASIWQEVRKFMNPLIEQIVGKSGVKTTSTEILDIRNLTSNLWQSYFNMRIYDPMTNSITTQRYVLNLRIGYFPERVVMAKTFTNPLGFAVTEFNIAKARKD